jgi:3-oxoacyl-[acyl-carrier protein] reductase
VTALESAHLRPQVDSERRVALVTGAVRNIGRAISERLQEDGYQLVVTAYRDSSADRRGAPATIENEEARALGEQHDWDVLFCDVADARSCRDLVDAVAGRYGRLDCLVNNAATWTYGPALEVTDDDWRRVLEVNIVAPMRLVREAHGLLRASPAARVVNVSSIGAEWSGNGVAPYNVSKAGISSLTRALAIELADDGIAVNAVAPGFIDTSSNAHELDDDRALARRLALVPAGQPGRPEDVANLVSFLASPRLGFVTGSVVTIDGGQLAGARKGLIS